MAKRGASREKLGRAGGCLMSRERVAVQKRGGYVGKGREAFSSHGATTPKSVLPQRGWWGGQREEERGVKFSPPKRKSALGERKA